MTIILIILLILLVIYLYYQNRKLSLDSNDNSSAPTSNHRTIFALDEDLIADKDQAIRDKQEAEQEALSLSNKLRLKNQEVSRKEAEIERLKSEKNKVEVNLNSKIKEVKQQNTEQLRKINVLFDKQAQDYKEIDFNGLYALLEKIAQEQMPGSFPKGDNND
jgi:hypothetical protein